MRARSLLMFCAIVSAGCYARSDLSSVALMPESPSAFVGEYANFSDQEFGGEHVSLWSILSHGGAAGDVASLGCTVALRLKPDGTLDAALHKDGTLMGTLNFSYEFANGHIELEPVTKWNWFLIFPSERLKVCLSLWLDRKSDLMLAFDRFEDFYMLYIPVAIGTNDRHYTSTHKRITPASMKGQ